MVQITLPERDARTLLNIFTIQKDISSFMGTYGLEFPFIVDDLITGLKKVLTEVLK